MSAEFATQVALPGSSDLDLDVSGLTVAAVVAEGREILVRLTGGRGAWVESGSGEWVSDLMQASADLRAQFGDDMPADLFAAFVARLERWRDQAAPVRMCAAPDRLSLLIADDGDFVPWPRRWPPPDETEG